MRGRSLILSILLSIILTASCQVAPPPKEQARKVSPGKLYDAVSYWYENDPLSMPSMGLTVVAHGKSLGADEGEVIFVDAPARRDGKMGIDFEWQSDTQLQVYLSAGQVRTLASTVDVDGKTVQVDLRRNLRQSDYQQASH